MLNKRKHKQLFEACRTADVEKVRWLLSIGVSPRIRNESGATPLHFASANGNAEIVLMLIRKDADVNDQGVFPGPRSPFLNPVTPLMEAEQFKQKVVAKILRANGAH